MPDTIGQSPMFGLSLLVFSLTTHQTMLECLVLLRKFADFSINSEARPAPTKRGIFSMKKTIPILFFACLLTATCLALPPVLGLVKTCSNPPNCTTATLAPGTDVTYSIGFSNSGDAVATNTTIADPIPINTDYKLGSATSSPGTTGITFVIEYSADNGATWAYIPASGGGGAAAGYDRNVKIVRWRTTNTLSFTAPNNSGSVSFIARIQ